MVWDELKKIFMRTPPPERCLHAVLIFDTYQEERMATCQGCGEVWISGEAEQDWIPIELEDNGDGPY